MTSGRYLIVPLFILLPVTLLIAMGAAQNSAQDPAQVPVAPTIRLDVPLVDVDVRVIDASGKPVTNLTRDDFTIYEDGQEQSVGNFAAANSACSVLVLIEGFSVGKGGTQTTQAIPAIQKLMRDDQAIPRGLGMQGLTLWTLNHLLKFLRAGDRFALAEYTYKDITSLVVPWQPVQPGEQKTLQIPYGKPPVGYELLLGKNLYGALGWTAQQFRGVEGRKAAIVFSVGLDRSASPTFISSQRENSGLVDPLFGLPDSAEESAFQGALKAMRLSGVPFYFIVLDPQFIVDFGVGGNIGSLDEITLLSQVTSRTGSSKRSVDMIRRAHARMEQAADATGGRIYYPQAMEEIRDYADQISKDLITYYNIAYRPPKPGGNGEMHQIEVRVRDKNLHVIQSREVYSAN